MVHKYLLLLFIALSACTRPEVSGLSDPGSAATISRVFVATQRRPDQFGDSFGLTRSARMNYATFDISIPDSHRTGQIERTSGIADANRFFAPVAVKTYDREAEFMRAMDSEKTGDGGILLFVHGYNNTLEDATYRVAQIRRDFGITQPGLLFAWPSAGDPRGYVYDRDSALFARDAFEGLLRDLHRRGQKRILLVAHSMGSYLTMEVLRQIALKGEREIYQSIEGVILMSPDLDPDVFRQQAEAIGALPQPFVIMSSRRDRVLSLAGLLTGRKPRLGRIEGPEAVEGLGVTVIDFTDIAGGEGAGHDVAFTSPIAIQLLRGMEARVRGGAGRLQEYVLLGKEHGTGTGLLAP